MGMTVEFYSADPQALVALFGADLALEEEEEDTFFEQLKAYPVADFSLHLQMEDLDRLCQSLSKQHSLIPPVFRDSLIEQVWDDGPVITESLTLLSGHFAMTVAELSENAIENAARDWTAPFSLQEPLQQTPAYQALWQLQEVARDAVARKQSLVLHLAGHPLF
jgi:hypothetical protein